MVWKDKKAFTKDMKAIYNAPNKELAAVALDQFEENWKGLTDNLNEITNSDEWAKA